MVQLHRLEGFYRTARSSGDTCAFIHPSQAQRVQAGLHASRHEGVPVELVRDAKLEEAPQA